VLTCYVLFFFMLLRPPRSSLFPYTTLFRSRKRSASLANSTRRRWAASPARGSTASSSGRQSSGRSARARYRSGDCSVRRASSACSCRSRSEEHTSELQSRENLVCRLLLEKKKTTELLTQTLARFVDRATQ